MRHFKLLFIILGILGGCGQVFASPQEKFERIFDINNKMADYKVPAVSIAVIHKGRLDWSKAYGMAQPNLEANKYTRFQACSISKPVSALSVLKLVDQEMLSLDHDINNFLSQWKIPYTSDFPKKTPVTIRNLLNHTAGFATGRRPMYPLGSELPNTLQILRGEPPALSEKAALQFTPGSKWQYSGLGYIILQELLEEKYGESYNKLADALILTPLKMENSSFTYPVPQELQIKLAYGYNEHGLKMEHPYYNIADLMAGGLWTTSEDLAKFIIEIQSAMTNDGNIILSQNMVMEMLKENKNNFGLGLKIGEINGQKWFAHGGDNAGYKALLFGFTNSKEGVVILTNSDNGWDLCLEILRTIGELYNWPKPLPQSF